MRRVSIVGCSGTGKSRLGRALAERIGVPYVELDGIYHQADWQHPSSEEFRAAVAAVTAGDAWVIDGNYSEVQDIVRDRADTIVWLDLPKAVVMRRVVGRTLRRVAFREVLWNGNRERWRNLVRLDPEESIILWAWTRHGTYASRYGSLVDDRWIRLRSRGEVAAFLSDCRP